MRHSIIALQNLGNFGAESAALAGADIVHVNLEPIHNQEIHLENLMKLEQYINANLLDFDRSYYSASFCARAQPGFCQSVLGNDRVGPDSYSKLEKAQRDI